MHEIFCDALCEVRFCGISGMTTPAHELERCLEHIFDLLEPSDLEDFETSCPERCTERYFIFLSFMNSHRSSSPAADSVFETIALHEASYVESDDHQALSAPCIAFPQYSYLQKRLALHHSVPSHAHKTRGSGQQLFPDDKQ
jgi:hypothetical protein